MYVSCPITNISRGSLHDGPGVRTVVYFKGCGLRCKWCHNPETLSVYKEILYVKSKCIHCGKCVEICPKHHKITGNEMVFDRKGCIMCGKCAEVCPSLALNVSGKDMSEEELINEINKDIHYFNESGGGVTFSGGECLLYPDFLANILKRCNDLNIHTAIESAMYVPWNNIEKIIPYTDLFFADLKLPGPEKHKEFTGKDNILIIENISKLSKIHNNIIIRIPVIPGVNDTETDIIEFSKIINSFGDGIKGVELLRYNNLAESKYDISGRKYTSFALSPQNDDEMKEICEKFNKNCNKHCYFI